MYIYKRVQPAPRFVYSLEMQLGDGGAAPHKDTAADPQWVYLASLDTCPSVGVNSRSTDNGAGQRESPYASSSEEWDLRARQRTQPQPLSSSVGAALPSILDGKGGNVPSQAGQGVEPGHPQKAPRKFKKKHYMIRQSLRDHMRAWRRHGLVLFFVTLTSGNDSQGHMLRKHFEVWRKRIARHYGVDPGLIQYRGVDTTEGNGVLHMILAVPQVCTVLVKGQRWLAPASMLKEWWDDIHGARFLNVKLIQDGDTSVRRLTGYIVTQYVAGQDALIRMSGSRADLPLSRLRQTFRRMVFDHPGRFMTNLYRAAIALPYHFKPEGEEQVVDNMMAESGLRTARNEWWHLFREAWARLLERGSVELFGDRFVLWAGDVHRV